VLIITLIKAQNAKRKTQHSYRLGQVEFW